MSETVNTTHRADQSTCLTHMYVYTPDYYMYYKSMPLLVFTPVADATKLVFTPVADAIWLPREESKKWSYKLSNIPKSAATGCLCSLHARSKG